MSNCVQPHRRQPTRLLCPWDCPGKKWVGLSGVGCHFLLQRMKVKSEREVAQSCPTPSDPMDSAASHTIPTNPVPSPQVPPTSFRVLSHSLFFHLYYCKWISVACVHPLALYWVIPFSYWFISILCILMDFISFSHLHWSYSSPVFVS